MEEEEQLREFDEYGDDKLSCEEILIQQQERGGFPWVSLRFSDVIGPSNTSPRWFFYHIWIKLYTNIGEVVPFYIPDDVMDQPLSLTYVMDAAWINTRTRRRRAVFVFVVVIIIVVDAAEASE